MSREEFRLDKVAIGMVKEPPLYSDHPLSGPDAVVKLMADTLRNWSGYQVLSMKTILKDKNLEV